MRAKPWSALQTKLSLIIPGFMALWRCQAQMVRDSASSHEIDYGAPFILIIKEY